MRDVETQSRRPLGRLTVTARHAVDGLEEDAERSHAKGVIMVGISRHVLGLRKEADVHRVSVRVKTD